MSPSLGRSPGSRAGRALPLVGAALLLCTLALAGCTQPLIPSPVPSETTHAAVTTAWTPAPTPATTSPVTQRTSSDYLPYANAPHGFSLSYPVGWSMQENLGGSVVAFTAPSSGMSDIPANFRVSIEDLSANPMGLEQYKTTQLAKRQKYDQYNNIHDSVDKEKGFSGWKIGYTYNAGSLIKTFEIYIIRGTTAYTISYSSREDRFATYSQVFDNMIKSFQFTA